MIEDWDRIRVVRRAWSARRVVGIRRCEGAAHAPHRFFPRVTARTWRRFSFGVPRAGRSACPFSDGRRVRLGRSDGPGRGHGPRPGSTARSGIRFRLRFGLRRQGQPGSCQGRDRGSVPRWRPGERSGPRCGQGGILVTGDEGRPARDGGALHPGRRRRAGKAGRGDRAADRARDGPFGIARCAPLVLGFPFVPAPDYSDPVRADSGQLVPGQHTRRTATI